MISPWSLPRRRRPCAPSWMTESRSGIITRRRTRPLLPSRSTWSHRALPPWRPWLYRCGVQNRRHEHPHPMPEPASLHRLILPAGLLAALFLAAHWGPFLAPMLLDAEAPAGLLLRALVWVAGAFLAVRLLDVLLWHGAVTRRSGRPPPRLLVDLGECPGLGRHRLHHRGGRAALADRRHRHDLGRGGGHPGLRAARHAGLAVRGRGPQSRAALPDRRLGRGRARARRQDRGGRLAHHPGSHPRRGRRRAPERSPGHQVVPQLQPPGALFSRDAGRHPRP